MVYTPFSEHVNVIKLSNFKITICGYSQALNPYRGVADPYLWADSGDCAGAANCWGQSPECLEIKGATGCGSATSPSVNMAPYIGAGDSGAAYNIGWKVNNGGSPVTTRTPQCNANLGTATHPATCLPQRPHRLPQRAR